MSKLDQVVFVIENDQIIEGAIRDFCGFIDETTTPHGVAPRFHVRGTELWTWGPQGQFPRCVNSFDTEAEAIEAMEDHHAHDFWNCDRILACKTRADAEDLVKQIAEDAE